MRRCKDIISINDLRAEARRRTPRAVFDFLDGGAEDERTLRENEMAFAQIYLRPRSGFRANTCNLETRIVDQRTRLPVLLAPLGYSRLVHPGGELAAASAANRVGAIYCLSTMSGYRLEDVKAKIDGPAWFQLYLFGGRAVAESVLHRAKVAGYSTLVITIDATVAGRRERDLRNGVASLLGPSLVDKLLYLPDILSSPRWLMRFLLDRGNRALHNLDLPESRQLKPVDIESALKDAGVTWHDLDWIKEIWSGPIVIKGIQTAEDARRAVSQGAAGIVVSNHGGRQLDCVAGSLRVLPRVVEAVGSQIEILIDGGIRRGSDAVKALCLGARGVLLGRAYAYGLAAFGEDGVVKALTIIREEMERTMTLLGVNSVHDLDASFIDSNLSIHR